MRAEPMFAVDAPLRFQVGARTLLSLPRRLIRVAWSLDDVLAGRVRALPRLRDADGYLVTSLPEELVANYLPRSSPHPTVRAERSRSTGDPCPSTSLRANGVEDARATAGFLALVRQRYPRHHTDLTIGHAAWLAQLSANARSAIRRKAKRLAEGGAPDIRAYRTAEEIAAFHALARPLSAATYQERLLGSGLPDTPIFLMVAQALAAKDAVRAWLLFRDGAPIAYLWCTADGDTLRYDHVGHDPGFAHLSPGAVLHAEAMRQLFGDRFARFDFTEGDGQHKRQFATASTPCVDLLLLRPTLANRVALTALKGFDGAMARAKRWAQHGWAKRLGDRLRRS